MKESPMIGCNMDSAVAAAPSTRELIERARKIAPALKSRAFDADKARRVPDESIRELIDAQLFQILVPRRYGGFEQRFSTVLDVGLELARGCGSTAWLYCLLCNHHWILAQYPLESQAELYGGNTHAFFPQTVSGKGGGAKAVEGGYVINGQWSFATGIDFSDWVSATVSVQKENPHPLHDRINFIAKTSEGEVVDTWFTSGMRATGSRDFTLKDVFVPSRRIITQADMLGGRTPGRQALPEYVMLGAPYFSVLLSAVLGPLLGLTLRTIEEFVAYTTSRVGIGGVNHANRSSTQIKLGYAQARYDAMYRAARAIFEEMEDALLNGQKIGAEQKIRNRRDAAYVGDECTKIVDSLVSSAGSRGQTEASPFQMIQRDVHTIRTHIVFDLEDATEAYGRQMLGLPIDVLRF
jgi:3-hydroxy-9,10-secoandrosta-1,3,5(10)-triene-9,17-dione monooxygenase